MKDFVYDTRPVRVVFGAGRIDSLGDELVSLGLTRVLLLASARQRAAIPSIDEKLKGVVAGTFERISAHAEVDLHDQVIETGRGLDIDGTVAIGGGSAIGLAKAIALELNVPIAAVPTTYSGSEMTPIWGVTVDGVKRTGRDPRVLPRLVIYDPAVVAGLPPRIAGPSGMNAIAHCVELCPKVGDGLVRRRFGFA
ncbi:MAG: maleylacetate reductase [Hyphomicrobiales bacterium]|nr:maleylacetate reductase [Hyphomicrobiales bacterium]